MGLNDGPPAQHHLERGAEWRRSATELLVPLTPLLAVAKGAKPAWDDLVLIDAHRVRTAARCLARVGEADGGFVESTRTARRRVGLAVLQVLRDRPDLDPVTAFEQVIAHRADRLPEQLVSWVDGLGAGGVAALAQEAVGYASAVTAWVPPARMGTVAISAPGDWLTWQVPERALRVRSRCDALAPRGARPPARRILVVERGLDDAELVAGHAALAYTLMMGSVPARVTVLAPASGKVAVAVDDDLLAGALDRAGAAAHAAVADRFGPVPPTTPGWWCRRCGRLEECADGPPWVAARPARIGGLTPLAPHPPMA